MKLAKKAELELGDDPRNIRDPAVFHNFRVMVEDQALDPAWCCVMWRLHRAGVLSLPQRMAGDAYLRKFQDFCEVEKSDPESDLIPEARQLAYKRIDRRKKEMRRVWEVLGSYRKVVHSVVVDDHWPAGYAIMYENRKDLGNESERQQLVEGLQLLADLFSNGRTKRVRNKA